MSSRRKQEGRSQARIKPVFFGYAVEVYRQGRPPKLRWRWGRIGITLLALSLAGYLAFCSALFWYYREKREFKEVTVAQILTWPVKRDAFRAAMGEYFIKKARSDFEAGNISQGFHFLRAGVARKPDDLEARIQFAEILDLGLKRTDLAINVLKQGVPYAKGNISYLRKFINLLMRNQEDLQLIQFSKEQLKEPAELPRVENLNEDSPDLDLYRWQSLLAFATAQAHYFRGNYDQAEELIEEYQLSGGHDALFLQAMIQWRRGRSELAIALLQEGLERFPGSDKYYLQLTEFHRELGDPDTARQYAILRAINEPENPIPRIDLLYSFHQMEDKQRELAETEALLKKYANDERVLQMLANYAAETGQESLARRIYGMALQNNFEISPFALLVIESQITQGAFPKAIAFCEQLEEEQPAWLQNKRIIFNSLRAAAYFGAERLDLGQLYLSELLDSPNLRSETLVAVSRRLVDLGFQNEAARVLENAVERNPKNQQALTRLIEVNLRRGHNRELPNLVGRLLEMRRPSYQLLEKIYELLGSDRYLFSQYQETLLSDLRAALNERLESTG